MLGATGRFLGGNKKRNIAIGDFDTLDTPPNLYTLPRPMEASCTGRRLMCDGMVHRSFVIQRPETNKQKMEI